MQTLHQLFPDINPLFLDILQTKILQDSSWVNKAFDTYQKEFQETIPDSDEGHFATLSTICEILTMAENIEFSQNEPEEPTQITLTATICYGS